MNSFLRFIGINNNTKFSFMSSIGSIIILAYLFTISYELVQINYLFIKGKLDQAVFERYVNSSLNLLQNIVSIVILFFFKNTIDKSINSINSNSNKIQNGKEN